MHEAIEAASNDLQNKRAGWVTRRDAAETLGQFAQDAIKVLLDFEDESDVDVRSGVEKTLGKTSAVLAHVEPSREGQSYTLQELAQHCEKGDQRTLAPHENGFVIKVVLRDKRTQSVYLMPFTLKDGTEQIRVYTYCGKTNEEALRWALRANMKLAQGALAITTHEGDECFVLTNCYVASEATPSHVKLVVKQIAFYGDWVEKKLTGQDEF